MLHNASYTYAYFFWILSPIKMKFGLVLVCCMTNISNMFLAECWRLEKPVRSSLMILLKWQYSKMWPFLINNETLESWHIWLLSNWARLLNWKGPGIKPQSPKLFKRLLKITVLAYIYQLAKFGDFMICGSKDIFKNAPYLMY